MLMIKARSLKRRLTVLYWRKGLAVLLPVKAEKPKRTRADRQMGPLALPSPPSVTGDDLREHPRWRFTIQPPPQVEGSPDKAPAAGRPLRRQRPRLRDYKRNWNNAKRIFTAYPSYHLNRLPMDPLREVPLGGGGIGFVMPRSPVLR